MIDAESDDVEAGDYWVLLESFNSLSAVKSTLKSDQIKIVVFTTTDQNKIEEQALLD